MLRSSPVKIEPWWLKAHAYIVNAAGNVSHSYLVSAVSYIILMEEKKCVYVCVKSQRIADGGANI